MKIHGNPRLVCRVVRFRDAVFSSRALGHVAGCPDCQAYFQAESGWVNALRAAAPRPAAGDDRTSALAEQIIRSVRQTAPVSRRASARNGLVAAMGSLAVFALAFFLVRFSPTAHRSEAELSAVDMRRLVADVQVVRTRLLENMGPSAKKIAADNPLSQELASVQMDARSAVKFFAMNFIPTDSTSGRMPGNDHNGF